MKPKFSVVLIARNESKTLPRLVGSLAEFKNRGGEIILVDTGSTDDTAEIARGLGCKVTEVGNKFRRVITQDEADRINMDFIASGEADIVKAGDSLFDYSSARNFAATLASNDMVAMPDCDEIYTKLEIDQLDERINSGVEQIEYNFVFSHDAEGGELVKFMHSKFYNRTVLRWTGIIHEVLVSTIEMAPTRRCFLEESTIKLEHFQNHETNRGHYLKGLALSVLLDPSNDRNLHYFGRELMYVGHFKSAIQILEKHVALNKWAPEKSQSQIHIGECYMMTGDSQKAIHSYIDAFDTCPTRREPLMKIAEYYRRYGSADHVLSYVAAALQIPGDNFYANFQPYYENVPHELMYWALWEKGEYNASKRHFDHCLAYQPFNSKYLQDYRNYYQLPTMSIIAPIKGRPEGTKRMLESIKNLNYPQDKIEVVLVYDGEEAPIYETGDNFKVVGQVETIGVPKSLKFGVEVSTGDWIVYAANDMEFEPDCLMAALKQAMDNNKFFMAFHEGPVGEDEGNIATHFMIHRKLLDKINGEIFDTEFHHVGVDNFLWAQMKKLNQAMHCNRAKITHYHFGLEGNLDEVNKIGWSEENVKHDRELLNKKLSALNNA